ncbi:MAG: single-stranded DNA-binding protein [Candidatus Levybacteria bacterium]|nr:single-stranded DNA-binding protein [Candidatus Levybacteria bacterium]
MARSLNRVQLIGNLTRDPELRYTPSGTAVCSFGLATNRSWTTDTGEKHEETEFHRIVAWSKLAELCSQFLVKGRKVYVEGRLSTRSWTAQDGQQRSATEVVIDDMILLDSKRTTEGVSAQPKADQAESATQVSSAKPSLPKQEKPVETKKEKEEPKKEEKDDDEEVIAPDDIPF